MIILAIDTSSAQGLVALKTAQGKIHTLKNLQQLEHNSFILPAVQTLLQTAGLRLTDIDYFAAGRGPGSFVGTRLAVAVIQGLAFGIQKPVVGTSHLKLIALSGNLTEVLLDAKMQGFYRLHEEEEEFHRFTDQAPIFTPMPVLRGEDLIQLAEQEIANGRVFKDPSQLQPVYLQDEGNWKKQ